MENISIILNEYLIVIEPGTTLFQVIAAYKPDADLWIVNGFPIARDCQFQDGDRVVLITRGEMPAQDELETLMAARHTPGVHAKLKRSRVGIAGLGGLGSNVAVALARVGVGTLIVADFDVVEPSNLNRQHYFIEQIGKYKTEAIREVIARINPFITVIAHQTTVTETNVVELFGGADVIVEAFDRADMKAMLIETALLELPDTPIVCGSGMAGYGRNQMLHTRQIDKLYICGDEESEAKPGQGLMAPRVGIVANMQANQVMEILLNATIQV